MVRKKLYGFGCAFGPGFGDINAVASVMLGSPANVPSINAMGCPHAAIGRCFKDKDLGPWWRKGGLIEIKNTVELSFGRQAWIDSQGAEKVQGQGRLREKSIP